jgi:hypothetical protein
MTYIRKIKIAITTLAILATGALQGNEGYATPQDYFYEPCAPACSGCDCGRYFIDAEALYLRASEGGLFSVCDSTSITNTTVGGIVFSTLDATGRDANFEWDWGFRLGAGYELPGCPCDLGIFWTHLNSSTGQGTARNEHRWNLEFNVVDGLYSCGYRLSPCFVIIPFGGLKYANIEQKLRTHFVNTVNGVGTTSKASIKEDFWGIGPLVGIDGDWGIGCGFSFYGDISFALLYGKFHVQSNKTEVLTSAINNDDTRSHLQAIQAVIDAGLGLRYRTCVCSLPVVMQLGLEHHQYFNHNQFCGYGDLYLDGVTFGVGIAY